MNNPITIFTGCMFSGKKASYIAKESVLSVDFKRKLIICKSPKEKFIKLWNEVSLKRGFGWDTNPFVWVIEFKKIKE